jgi:hypothetical protein
MAAELFQKVLLLLGADAARREISNQARSLGYAALAYAVLAVFMAVAFGFATAAAYIALATAYGAITGCLVVSAVFLTLGVIAFFAISAQRRPPQVTAAAQPVTLESALADLQKPVEDLIAKNGLKSVAVAGAAAFIAATLLRKRK